MSSMIAGISVIDRLPQPGNMAARDQRETTFFS
jgi:hypothetical protein